MEQVISTEKIPIKLWTDDIDSGALAQAKNLANLPFAFKWVSIMSDCHQGYGMPIGGVLATKDVIIPNCVGVDIGCGMCAVKTSLTEIDRETLKKIMGEIREIIPVGFSRQKEDQDINLMPEITYPGLPDCGEVLKKEYKNARTQIGTLGGGNHFIEIQKGSDHHIWIMIHSGSRNLGYKVAKHYNKIAVNLNEKWHSKVPAEWGLAFLPIDSKEAKDYLLEMNYCVDFAFANRKLMMERVCDVFAEELKKHYQSLDEHIAFDELINIAHNYASLENHFGQNVWVHRKGATEAREGTIGIVPGSQGTASYIVRGKGNPESFMSCSHGAGRRMGRKQAIRELSMEDEVKALEDKGILHSIRSVKQLDEAPSAYKPIDVVMKNQEDLVDIVVELKPLAVIKG